MVATTNNQYYIQLIRLAMQMLLRSGTEIWSQKRLAKNEATKKKTNTEKSCFGAEKEKHTETEMSKVKKELDPKYKTQEDFLSKQSEARGES